MYIRVILADGAPTGVYLVVSLGPDDCSRRLDYLGETDNVLKRFLNRGREGAGRFSAAAAGRSM